LSKSWCYKHLEVPFISITLLFEKDGQMNKINWNQVLVVCLVLLVVLIIGTSVIRTIFWGGQWGMMGPGMMYGWDNWGMGPGDYPRVGLLGGIFGSVFSIFGMLIPVGSLVLVFLGCVWLIRSLSEPKSPNNTSSTCPACSQQVSATWKHCPHCGEAL
jgi:hypothetical protein